MICTVALPFVRFVPLEVARAPVPGTERLGCLSQIDLGLNDFVQELSEVAVKQFLLGHHTGNSPILILLPIRLELAQ